jgi:hypothetical protein
VTVSELALLSLSLLALFFSSHYPKQQHLAFVNTNPTYLKPFYSRFESTGVLNAQFLTSFKCEDLTMVTEHQPENVGGNGSEGSEGNHNTYRVSVYSTITGNFIHSL